MILWEIAIDNNIVFITDSGNKRIQALTHNGKFIFEYKHKNFKDIRDIIIVDNFILVSDWRNDYIMKFELVYN
jgi:hypothetical protein